jgi:DNA invertase Pin-like site-specific DNA recombinase
MKKLGLEDWNLDVNMDNVKFVQRTQALIEQAELEKDILKKIYEVEIYKRKKKAEEEWNLIKEMLAIKNES